VLFGTERRRKRTRKEILRLEKDVNYSIAIEREEGTTNTDEGNFRTLGRSATIVNCNIGTSVWSVEDYTSPVNSHTHQSIIDDLCKKLEYSISKYCQWMPIILIS
jgi:hypothetical protein